MLSTRISRRAPALGSIAGALALVLLGACAPTKPIPSGEPGASVDPNATVKVALLAPLGSGDPGRERIGANLVNAAKLAQGDLTNATIDLVVYPDQGTSAGGAAAARQAVAEGAKIIIGPLFSTATAGAGPVAQAAGVTMLSLSNNPDVAGGNVYILGNTFANSAEQIVGFAQSRGLNSFGVVYPNGIEGEAAKAAAEAAITRRGGVLVASQGYNVSVASIDGAAPAAAQALQSTGANAIILTDGPTGGLGLMAKGLRAGGLSPEYAQFLGMQRWDVSAEAVGDPALQGGAFVAPDPSYAGAFAGRYQNAYGEAPHELASLAFDGVAAVGALIAEARSQGGEPFAPARITQASGFAGASGPFRLLPDGTIQRNLAIMTVQNGTATIARGAARSFDSLSN